MVRPAASVSKGARGVGPVQSWWEVVVWVSARGRGWTTSACAVERSAEKVERARRGCILTLLAVSELIDIWLVLVEMEMLERF